MASRYRDTSWLNPRLKLRSSRIHGRGLASSEAIGSGEVVIVFGGNLFSKEDIATGKADNRTLLQVSEQSWLGNLANEPIGEDYFINHSCDPNLWMVDEVTLVARRNIVAEEEVTMDYATHFADPNWIMKQPCHCGSSLCRGQIRGTDWMLKDLQKRYSGHFSPLLNQHIARLQKQI